jgi:hypothetical protein
VERDGAEHQERSRQRRTLTASAFVLCAQTDCARGLISLRFSGVPTEMAAAHFRDYSFELAMLCGWQ